MSLRVKAQSPYGSLQNPAGFALPHTTLTFRALGA